MTLPTFVNIDDFNVVISDQTETRWDSFRIVEKLNQMSMFEMKFLDVSYGDSIIQENNIVHIMIGNTVVFKGTLTKITPESDGYLTSEGWDQAIKILRRSAGTIDPPRIQYDNT